MCALQDAFGENDVYVVTTIGVAKKDMLKDGEGALCEIASNRHCPTVLGAFPVCICSIFAPLSRV